MDQCVVPVAVPEPPVELVHVTDVTPTLSDAVPANTIVLVVVYTFVLDGDRIVRVGAVVSGVAGGGFDGGGFDGGGFEGGGFEGGFEGGVEAGGV